VITVNLSEPDPTSDPGWRAALRIAAWALIPGFGITLQQRRAASGRVDGLTMLRSLFLSFSGALVMIGGVVAVLTNFSNLNRDRTGSPAAVAAGVLAVIGVGTLVASAKLGRPLPATSLSELGGAYRTRFFLRLAFSEAAALCGFVAYIITGRWWMYPLGAAFAAAGFSRLAPTAANLAGDQDQITASGSGLSVIAAVRTATPPAP
jgi:hypothetical protein